MTKKELQKKCKRYNIKWKRFKKLIKEMNWKCKIDDKNKG